MGVVASSHRGCRRRRRLLAIEPPRPAPQNGTMIVLTATPSSNYLKTAIHPCDIQSLVGSASAYALRRMQTLSQRNSHNTGRRASAEPDIYHHYLGSRASATLRHMCTRIRSAHTYVLFTVRQHAHACGSSSQASFTTCLCPPPIHSAFTPRAALRLAGLRFAASRIEAFSLVQPHIIMAMSKVGSRGEDRSECCG